MKEKWRDVVGYEGLYQVSNLGRIKSLYHFPANKIGNDDKSKSRILRQGKATHGRTNDCYVVVLCKNKIKKTSNVHRLVAIAFIPNPLNKPHINHIDGNPLNNICTNLEWCTPKENTQDALRRGTFKEGENGPNASFTNRQVLEIRKEFNGRYGEITKLAIKYGISASTMQAMIKRKTYKNI